MRKGKGNGHRSRRAKQQPPAPVSLAPPTPSLWPPVETPGCCINIWFTLHRGVASPRRRGWPGIARAALSRRPGPAGALEEPALRSLPFQGALLRGRAQHLPCGGARSWWCSARCPGSWGRRHPSAPRNLSRGAATPETPPGAPILTESTAGWWVSAPRISTPSTTPASPAR